MKANSPWAQRTIVGSALAVFGFATLLYFYMEHVQTTHAEQDRLVTQAHVIEENIYQNLAALNSVLEDVRKKGMPQVHSGEFNTYLRTLADAMPSVRTVTLVNESGRVVAASRKELINVDLSHRDYFKDVQRDGDVKKLYVSRPFFTVLNIYSINVSRMLTDANGAFAGIVTATLDPTYFVPLLDSIRYAPDMNVALIHWDGTVFQRVSGRDAGARAVTPENLIKNDPYFDVHRKSGRHITFRPEASDPAGAERMLIQQTIQPKALVMDKSLVVQIERSTEKVYAPWRNRVILIGSVYLTIFFLSSAILFAFQRRQKDANLREEAIARKLEASERFMKAIADALPALVAYWDKAYRCRFANDAYLEWFGKSPQELIGTRIQDLLGEELYRKNEPYITGALKGERQAFERTLIKADGSIGYTWAQYIPEVDMQGDVQGFFVLVSDVTPLKQVQMALAESEWKFKTIIATEPECVTILATNGTVQQMNPAGLQMVGASSEDRIIGTNFVEMIDVQWQSDFYALLGKVSEGTTGMLAFKLVGLQNAPRWLESYAAPMRDRNGTCTGALCVIRDMTERKRAEEELVRLAQTDSLTGLANRRHFMSEAKKELERAQRYPGALTVLMMDIDHFKKINDSHGHKCGDAVIRKFAELCQSSLRHLDVIGRIGGEEFAVILPETSEKNGMEVAEQLRKKASQAEVHTDDGKPIRFTVSIGVASHSAEILDFEAFLAQADEALYRAKNTGRNKVCAYKSVGTA